MPVESTDTPERRRCRISPEFAPEPSRSISYPIWSAPAGVCAASSATRLLCSNVEMDAQAGDFEKRFVTRDEDMRGSLAFSKLGGLNTAMRYEVHLSRFYRRALTQLQGTTKIAKRT